MSEKPIQVGPWLMSPSAYKVVRTGLKAWAEKLAMDSANETLKTFVKEQPHDNKIHFPASKGATTITHVGFDGIKPIEPIEVTNEPHDFDVSQLIITEA